MVTRRRRSTGIHCLYSLYSRVPALAYRSFQSELKKSIDECCRAASVGEFSVALRIIKTMDLRRAGHEDRMTCTAIVVQKAQIDYLLGLFRDELDPTRSYTRLPGSSQQDDLRARERRTAYQNKLLEGSHRNTRWLIDLAFGWLDLSFGQLTSPLKDDEKLDFHLRGELQWLSACSAAAAGDNEAVWNLLSGPSAIPSAAARHLFIQAAHKKGDRAREIEASFEAEYLPWSGPQLPSACHGHVARSRFEAPIMTLGDHLVFVRNGRYFAFDKDTTLGFKRGDIMVGLKKDDKAIIETHRISSTIRKLFRHILSERVANFIAILVHCPPLSWIFLRRRGADVFANSASLFTLIVGLRAKSLKLKDQNVKT